MNRKKNDMPNYCDNIMTIVGDKESIDKFVNKANGLTQKYPPQFFDIKEKEDKTSVLSFHQLVPIPDDILVKNYSDYGYYVELDLWGVKWGAFNESLQEHVDGKATYKFTTAWCIPHKFLERVSVLFPTLTFYISFSEESPTRGRVIIKNGEWGEQLFEDTIKNSDGYPKWEENKSEEPGYEDAHFALAREWREKYLTEHDLWIKDCIGE